MRNKKNSMSSIVSQAFWIFSPSTNCIIVAYAVFVIIIVETVKRITANVVFIFHRGTNLLGLQIMCHLLLDQMLVMNPSNARLSETTSWFCCASDFRDWSSLRLLSFFFFFFLPKPVSFLRHCYQKAISLEQDCLSHTWSLIF